MATYDRDMRRHRVGLGAVLACAAVASLATPSAATSDVSVRRLAGDDRYETAAAIARATFPQRSGEPTAERAVIVRGDAPWDALAAPNAGQAVQGPVLLTPLPDVPQPTLAVVRDFRVRWAFILGETDVVSSRVESRIDEVIRQNGGYANSTPRVAGRDRYETAAAAYRSTYDCYSRIPRQIDGLKTAFLISGQEFADALSVGPISSGADVPVLLTARETLPRATEVALAFEGDGPEGAGCGGQQLEQVVIVGGDGVVSEDVAQHVRSLGYVVRRVAGANRQETAVRVFEFAEQELGWTAGHVNLARGDGFADALAGAPHAGREKAPILLTVGPDALGTVTRDFLRSRADAVASIDVLGGRPAVSDAVVADARQAATPR